MTRFRISNQGGDQKLVGIRSEVIFFYIKQEISKLLCWPWVFCFAREVDIKSSQCCHLPTDQPPSTAAAAAAAAGTCSQFLASSQLDDSNLPAKLCVISL